MVNKIVSYFFGTILTAAVGLISSSVFTRIFTKVEYGNYSLVMTFILTANVFTNQWIQQSINRYLPVQNSEQDINKIKNTIVFGICLESIALLVLFVITVPFLVMKLDRQWLPLALPALIYMLLANVYCILGVVLQAEMKAKTYSLLSSSSAVLKMTLSIILVFYVSKDISSLFWAASISVVLFVPVLWKKAALLSPAKITLEYTVRDYFKSLKGFATYGVPMTAWYIFANILSIGDRYIIQSFRGAGEVGIYAANYNIISSVAGLIAMPVLLTAHPFLMKSWSLGDKQATGKWLGKIVEGVVCFGVLLTALTWVFSKDLAEWFLGPEFREGYFIMPIVVAGAVFWQLGMYSQKPMEFVSATGSLVKLCLISAIINTVSNIILIPKYGYAAAAYTTLASYAIYFVSSYYVSNRIITWKINIVKITIETFPIMVLFCFVIAVRNHFDGDLNKTMVLTLSIIVCSIISISYLYRIVGWLRQTA